MSGGNKNIGTGKKTNNLVHLCIRSVTYKH